MKREGKFYEVRHVTDNSGLVIVEQHDMARMFEQIDAARSIAADQGYDNNNEKLLIVEHNWEKVYDDEEGTFLEENVRRKTVGIYEEGKYRPLEER